MEDVGEINELRFTQEPASQVEMPSSVALEEQEEDSETETESLRGSDDDGDDAILEAAAVKKGSPQPQPNPSKPAYRQTSSTRTVTRQKGSVSNGFDDSSDESDRGAQFKKESTQLHTPLKKRLNTLTPKSTVNSPSQKSPTLKQIEQLPKKGDDADPDVTLQEDADITTSGTPATNQQNITRATNKSSRRSRRDAFDSASETDNGTDVEEAPAKKSKQRSDSIDMYEHREHFKQPDLLGGANNEVSAEHPHEQPREADEKMRGTQEAVEEAGVMASNDPAKPLLNVFVYVDNYENAITNDLFPRPSIMSDIEWVTYRQTLSNSPKNSWSGIRDKITSLGGTIADLDDSSLTHIIIDVSDKQRVQELFDRTKR